jgi:hypothetical protein
MTPQSALGIQGLGSERSNGEVMTDDRELVCSYCPLVTAIKQSGYEPGLSSRRLLRDSNSDDTQGGVRAAR